MPIMPHLQIPRHGLQQFRGRRLARLELTESDIECSGWNTNVAGKQWSSWSDRGRTRSSSLAAPALGVGEAWWVVGFNWTRWLSYFVACPNKGGLFVYEFVGLFL